MTHDELLELISTVQRYQSDLKRESERRWTRYTLT
jgi:hypothetical protein